MKNEPKNEIKVPIFEGKKGYFLKTSNNSK